MHLRRLHLRRLFAACFSFAAVAACSPGVTNYAFVDAGYGGSSSSGTGGQDVTLDAGGPTGPPAADAGGLCGNDIHKIVTDPPNVYFVLDTSGSMSAPVTGGTRYSVVQHAAAQIVNHLKLLINAGAATFPGMGDQCAAGAEVFPLTYGNPTGFDSATKAIMPHGGTPTAATLAALAPKLTALPGKTVVVLATDGGPNCNTAAACDASECMENIEGCSPNDQCCAAGQNCCAPGGPAGPINCVDHAASVAAVKALADAGIKVYVIGIPGSKAYAKVLADMALAGGAAISAYPFYYEVDDLATIALVLAAAAGSAIPCTFTLADPPMDPSLTNVYFDKTVVLQDATDGWTWTASDQITLHGAACNKLHSGTVAQVQIVSGCPTEGAK
jgi:hypothetical protein